MTKADQEALRALLDKAIKGASETEPGLANVAAYLSAALTCLRIWRKDNSAEPVNG